WRHVLWGIAGTFAAFGAPAAALGALVGRNLPGPILLLGVAVLAVIAALPAMRRKAEHAGEPGCAKGSVPARLRGWARCVVAAVVVGFLYG
ncbi:hypothetical protein M2C68_19975, partial [Pseudomonas sp. BAgro211]|nr:hypothetical protein [Pseudomonas sp. BAgro211]